VQFPIVRRSSESSRKVLDSGGKTPPLRGDHAEQMEGRWILVIAAKHVAVGTLGFPKTASTMVLLPDRKLAQPPCLP
jgi:hypothetical protein